MHYMSKLGLRWLSIILFSFSLVFAGDILLYQFTLSKMVAQSLIISREIERVGRIDDEVVNYVDDTFNLEIYCIGNCSGDSDSITYQIVKQFNPVMFLIWPESIERIRIERLVYLHP